MVNRRSESCPRLQRKGSAQSAGTSPLQLRSCTLQDLGPEDKHKVAKLLKQVVDLGQEVQHLKQERDEFMQKANAFAEHEQGLQDGNRQLHKEHQMLKKKLGQVLLVLRASQAKVHALEAAQISSRDTSCSVAVQTEPVAALGQQEQLPAAHGTPLTRHVAPVQTLATASGVPPGSIDSAADRSILSSSSNITPYLQVAPGATISITINHAVEPVASAAPTAPSLAEQADPHGIAAAGPSAVGSSDRALECLGPAAHRSLHGVGHDAGCAGLSAIPTVPAPPAATSIPTTLDAVTAAAANVGSVDGVSMPSASNALTAVQPLECAAAGCQVQCSTSNGLACAYNPTFHTETPMEESGGQPYSAVSQALRAQGTSSSICRSGGARSILVDTTMQQFEAVPVHDVFVGSREVPVASPMIVPPSDDMVAAASSLLDWQAQHGFVAPREAAGVLSAPPLVATSACSGGAAARRTCGKVLSYDPAIGNSGAFYFVDVAEVTPDLCSVAGARPDSEPDAGLVCSANPLRHVFSVANNRGLATKAADMVALGQQQPVSTVQPRASHTRPQFPEATACQGVVFPTGAGVPLSLGRLKDVHAAAAAKVAPQALEPQEQERTQTPRSPCSSIATSSTPGHTRQLNAAAVAAARSYSCTDTPSSCDTNMSRMAVMLDEVARRQRWDLQPPPGVPQQELPQPVCSAQSFGTARIRQNVPDDVQGANANSRSTQGIKSRTKSGDGSQTDSFHSQRGSRSRERHESASFGSVTKEPVRNAVAPVPASVTSSMSFERRDVTERYDDSLVDILSQADEELECQHYRRQQQPYRHQQQPQSSRLSPAMAAHKAGASMEELLASNIYEENDVLSVILEQECSG